MPATSRRPALTRDVQTGAERTWGEEAARLLRLILPVALFVCAFLAFLPALDNALVEFDDHKILLEPTGWRGLEWSNIRWMFSQHIMGHYQPLTWLSYAFDYVFLDADPVERPRMFHFTSMVLHGLNAVLLYFVAARLLRAARDFGEVPTRIAAAAAALLWAVHPLRAESVAWATERRDVLSGLFLLLATLAYLRAFPARESRPASISWWALSVILLILSCLSKAWGMSFFIVAIILDWCPLRRLPPEPWRWTRPDALRILAQKIPYIAVGLATAYLAMWAQSQASAVRSLAEWPLPSRIVQSFFGLVWYPWATLWPTNLCALYDLRHGLNPWEPQYLACYAIVAAASLACLALWRRAPAILAAVAAYAVQIAPVLGLSQAGDQFMADRYSYLATIPFYLLLAGGVLLLAQRSPAARRWAIAGAPALAALVLIPLSLAQTRTWHDSTTLWRHAVQTGPERLMPRVNYANCLAAKAKALDDSGDLEQAAVVRRQAIDTLREATRIAPGDGRPLWPLADDLRHEGQADLARGDRDAAMRNFAEAEADYRESAKTLPQAYFPLVNLGAMLEKELSRPDDAIEAYRQAVYFVEHPRPGSIHSGAPYLSLGTALEREGDLAGARAMYEKAAADEDEHVRTQGQGHLALLNRRN